MPREDNRRLFFALWPPDRVRARMEKHTRAFVEASRGRAIPTANLHVTVAFIGAVPHSRINAVLEAGGQTAASAFDLSLDRIESLPRSRVLCLTTTHSPGALIELAERLRFNLLAQQFTMQRQVFRPHVTLVRDLPRRVAPLTIAPLQWAVNDFVLVDSRPGKNGSEYCVTARWPLQTVANLK